MSFSIESPDSGKGSILGFYKAQFQSKIVKVVVVVDGVYRVVSGFLVKNNGIFRVRDFFKGTIVACLGLF